MVCMLFYLVFPVSTSKMYILLPTYQVKVKARLQKCVEEELSSGACKVYIDGRVSQDLDSSEEMPFKNLKSQETNVTDDKYLLNLTHRSIIYELWSGCKQMLFFWTPLFLYLALQANKSQFKVVNRPAASQPEPCLFFSGKNSNCPKFPASSTSKSWRLLNPLLPLPAMKKDGPENCEKWASCCLKAIKYTSAKCHLSLSKQSQGHKLSDICRQKYIYFPAPPKNSSLCAALFSLSKKKKKSATDSISGYTTTKTYVMKERISIRFKITASVSSSTKIYHLKIVWVLNTWINYVAPFLKLFFIQTF